MVDTDALTVEEFARLADKTPGYVRRLARDGTLDAFRDGKRWMIRAGSLSVFADSSRSTGLADTWSLERQLLYSERNDLQLQLLEQRIAQLTGDNDSLRSENVRLRRAVAVLAGATADDPRA